MSKMSQKAADALADAAPTMLNALKAIDRLATDAEGPMGVLPYTCGTIKLERIHRFAKHAITEAHKL